MAQVRFKYINQIKEGTIYAFTSEIQSLPASNIQNELKGKYWKSREDQPFAIYSGNNVIPFKISSTVTVLYAFIDSGTYAASGLAVNVASNMNSVSVFDDHHCDWDSATNSFNIWRSGSAGGLLQLLFSDTTYSALTTAYLLGFERLTDYTGSLSYTGTSTRGNENEIIIDFTATASVTSIIVDNHNIQPGSVLRFRLADSATAFKGGWNDTSTIVKTITATLNSGIISVDFTATTVKAIQIYFANRDYSSTYIGIAYAGIYKVFQYHASSPDDISWNRKRIDNRTRYFTTEGGATLFDLRPRIITYSLPIDPLDPYYNSATENVINEMIDRVSNDTPFFVTFKPGDQTETAYVFVTSDYDFRRRRSTPVRQMRDLVFREQL